MDGDLPAVAGVPESTLTEQVLAGLPAGAPPAPWTCRCDAIVWWAWRPRSAGLPAAAGHPGRLVVGGALIGYSESPVGRYREVVGLLGGLGRHGLSGSVPFMAVDSPASLVGGRRNWALPKVLARFTGEPGARTMTAAGTGWSVSATVGPLGPSLPVRLAGRLEQPWPDGRPRIARLSGRATGRPALVRIDVHSDGSLAGWLRPGRHLGVLLLGAEFSLAAPTESA